MVLCKCPQTCRAGRKGSLTIRLIALSLTGRLKTTFHRIARLRCCTGWIRSNGNHEVSGNNLKPTNATAMVFGIDRSRVALGTHVKGDRRTCLPWETELCLYQLSGHLIEMSQAEPLTGLGLSSWPIEISQPQKIKRNLRDVF